MMILVVLLSSRSWKKLVAAKVDSESPVPYRYSTLQAWSCSLLQTLFDCFLFSSFLFLLFWYFPTFPLSELASLSHHSLWFLFFLLHIGGLYGSRSESVAVSLSSSTVRFPSYCTFLRRVRILSTLRYRIYRPHAGYGWQLAGSFSLSLLPSSLLHILSHGIFAILRTDGCSTGVKKKRKKRKKLSSCVFCGAFTHIHPTLTFHPHSHLLARSLTHSHPSLGGAVGALDLVLSPHFRPFCLFLTLSHSPWRPREKK